MPNTGIHALATDVRDRPAQGTVGEMVTISPLDRSRTVINSGGQAVQVWTVTVDNAVNDAVYTFTVAGVDISFTADSSATTAEVQDGLVLDYNDNPIAFGLATAAGSDPDVVITGRLKGTDFLVSDLDDNLTTVETSSSSDGEDIPFGRLMITQGFKTGEVDELGGLAKSSLLTAQVDTWILVDDSGVTFAITVIIEGQAYTGSIVSAGGGEDVEGPLLVTELNIALPANSVIATYVASTDSIVLTAEVAGKAFTSSSALGAPAAATVDTGTLTKSTTGLVSDSIELSASGISRRRSDVEVLSVDGDDPVYKGGSGVQVQSNGQIWVASSEAVTPSSPVYIELGVTADNGKFFATTSATRVLLSDRFRWVRGVRDNRDLIAALQIAL